MEKEEDGQIESINSQLYPNFDIEELEERLEMSKVITIYCRCNDLYQCPTYQTS